MHANLGSLCCPEPLDRFFDSEGDSQLEQNANDVMNDLALIVQMVDIECTVHRYFGDDQAIN